jgi:hypothetical protein
LQQATCLKQKADTFLETTLNILDSKNEQICVLLLVALKQYNDYSKKFTNQIERRLIKEEEILSSEKNIFYF